MASRALEIEILKGGRHAAYLDVTADPDDPAALQGELRKWLEANKWAQGTWSQFAAHVRFAGEYKVRKTVGAPR